MFIYSLSDFVQLKAGVESFLNTPYNINENHNKWKWYKKYEIGKPAVRINMCFKLFVLVSEYLIHEEMYFLMMEEETIMFSTYRNTFHVHIHFLYINTYIL